MYVINLQVVPMHYYSVLCMTLYINYHTLHARRLQKLMRACLYVVAREPWGMLKSNSIAQAFLKTHSNNKLTTQLFCILHTINNTQQVWGQ